MGFSKGEDSGRFWLDGEDVRYESQTYGSWRVPVAKIRLIGEMTNQDGPYSDDYFLCFVATDDGCWLQGSFYAKGRDEFLHELGERLGQPLELGLVASTDFASRILWPKNLVGKPMFRFTDPVPRGFWQRVTYLFLPWNLQSLPEIALAEVRGQRSTGKTAGGASASAPR